MRAPVFVVGELHAPVAGAIAEPRIARLGQLGRHDVNLGVGEVGDAAGVVEVEVGHRDVSDLVWGESERRQLADRGQLRSILDPE